MGTPTPSQMRSDPQSQRLQRDVEGPAAAAAGAGDAAVVVVAAGTERAAKRYSRRNRGAADPIGKITVPGVQACPPPPPAPTLLRAALISGNPLHPFSSRSKSWYW